MTTNKPKHDPFKVNMILLYGAAPDINTTPRYPELPELTQNTTNTATLDAPTLVVWQLTGDCKICGAPIFARFDPDNKEKEPEVKFHCECRNNIAKTKKPNKPKKKILQRKMLKD